MLFTRRDFHFSKDIFMDGKSYRLIVTIPGRFDQRYAGSGRDIEMMDIKIYYAIIGLDSDVYHCDEFDHTIDGDIYSLDGVRIMKLAAMHARFGIANRQKPFGSEALLAKKINKWDGKIE